MSPCYITYILIELLTGAIRGAGKSVAPMLISVFGVCGLRLLWLFTVVPAHHTLLAVEASYPITWAVTSVAILLYYRFGRWLHRPRRRKSAAPIFCGGTPSLQSRRGGGPHPPAVNLRPDRRADVGIGPYVVQEAERYPQDCRGGSCPRRRDRGGRLQGPPLHLEGAVPLQKCSGGCPHPPAVNLRPDRRADVGIGPYVVQEAD
ncbi:MAG: hypothetical protein ACLRWQ_11445 [Flavonifractor plautii]